MEGEVVIVEVSWRLLASIWLVAALLGLVLAVLLRRIDARVAADDDEVPDERVLVLTREEARAAGFLHEKRDA